MYAISPLMVCTIQRESFGRFNGRELWILRELEGKEDGISDLSEINDDLRGEKLINMLWMHGVKKEKGEENEEVRVE